MSGKYKRLYRSRLDRRLAGVCGGLADYFGVDPTVVRLIFLGAAFINLPGAVMAYLFMMMIVPESPVYESAKD